MSEKRKFIGLNAMPQLWDDSRIEMHEINCDRSLLDFDSVIINPERFFETYKPEGKNNDIPQLDMDDSRRIIFKYHKVKKRLEELLEQGKNVYVIVGQSNKCYRYTGQYSDKINRFGNRIPKIEIFDLYSFLPVEVLLEPMMGNCFELLDIRYKDFFSQMHDIMEYHSVIKVDNETPFLRIKGTDKTVGTTVRYLKGNIIFLPYFISTLFTYNNTGNELRQIAFNAIYSLDESLTKKEVVEYPEWIDNYNILTESEDMVQLQKLEKEKIELQRRIDAQNERLALFKKYKGLFTSTGEQLENVIKEVFGKMGFQVFPTEKGRTDVIAKYGDTDVVMEIKGLTKSAAEKNAAQLEKWASDFIDKNEKSAKPLLVVNAFRELPLEQRTEAAFPNQMQSYSKSRNHCLMTTTQLLCLFIEITENPECKDERINELLTTVGVYNRYPDYTKFIKKVK